MTNFEIYKDDLLKIEGDFAVDGNTRKIVECSTLDCVDCIFNGKSCFEGNKIEWLCEEEEYKESILSNDGLELINILSKINGKEYKYIYRSGNHVFIFCDKPNIKKYGIILDEGNYLEIAGYIDLFSNIKFKHGLYDIKNKCFIRKGE